MPVAIEHENETGACADFVQRKREAAGPARNDEEACHDRGGAHRLISLGRQVEPRQETYLGAVQCLDQRRLEGIDIGKWMRRVERREARHGTPPHKGVQAAGKAQRNRVAPRVGPPRPIEHALTDLGRAVEGACESLAEAARER